MRTQISEIDICLKSEARPLRRIKLPERSDQGSPKSDLCARDGSPTDILPQSKAEFVRAHSRYCSAQSKRQTSIHCEVSLARPTENAFKFSLRFVVL